MKSPYPRNRDRVVLPPSRPMPDMEGLLYKLNRLADEVSEGGKYPVRGYAWISQANRTCGKAVFRTDSQLYSDPPTVEGPAKYLGRIDIADPRIDAQPWSKRKHDKLTASLNRLRKRGYLVEEINRPAKEATPS